MRKNVLIIIIVVLATVLSVLAIVSCVPKGGDTNASSEQLNVSRNILLSVEYLGSTSNNQFCTGGYGFGGADRNYVIVAKRYANTGNVWSSFRMRTDSSNSVVCLSASVIRSEGAQVPVSVVFLSSYNNTGYTDDDGYADFGVRVGEGLQGANESSYIIMDIVVNLGTVPSDVYFPYMHTDTFNNTLSSLGGLDYEAGYRNGLIDNSTLEQARNASYNSGYTAGSTFGYSDGYINGYNNGLASADGAAYNDVTGVNAVIGLLGGINEALQVNIFGTFSIYDLLGVVVAFLLFFGFLRFFKG